MKLLSKRKFVVSWHCLFICVCVNTVGIVEDHVVLERVAARSCQFEQFGGTGGCDDSVSGGHGWYDVFDNSLGQTERHSLDAVLHSSLQSLLVDPGDVGRVVTWLILHLDYESVDSVEGGLDKRKMCCFKMIPVPICLF